MSDVDPKPPTVEEGYVWVIVNLRNPEKRSYAEDDDVAQLSMGFVGDHFELRILDVAETDE